MNVGARFENRGDMGDHELSAWLRKNLWEGEVVADAPGSGTTTFINRNKAVVAVVFYNNATCDKNVWLLSS